MSLNSGNKRRTKNKDRFAQANSPTKILKTLECSNKGLGSYEEARRKIEEYFHNYNYERVHQGIGGAVPGSRFHGIIGETARIESEISSHMIDFSKGYLVFKTTEHTISIVCSGSGMQIYLDGNLMSGGDNDSSRD